MTKQAPYAFGELYIAGSWRNGQSDKTVADTSPFDGSVLAQISQGTRADVDAAYACAAQMQPAWEAGDIASRADVMRRMLDVMDARQAEIIDWLNRESGSTVIKAHVEFGAARGMVEASINYAEGFADEEIEAKTPGMKSYVVRQALGVVGIISPWNFPFHLTMRSVAPALALGNAVVIKPASDTPVTGGLLIAKLFEEAGLPAGLLQVVAGPGSEIGDHFVEHQVPSLISFTGSTDVGRGVGRAATGGKWIKRVALELGGNAPIVVLEDADFDKAVQATTFGRFLHQGQICMSTNRAIVVDALYDRFVEAVVARAAKIKCGNPSDPETCVGPLINEKQKNDVLARIEKAKAQGARLVLGGAPQGNVVPPHVFADVDPASSIAVDETFGPVLPIIRARDEAHALELANGSEFGLSGAVFTKDTKRGMAFAKKIVAGMIHVNSMSVDDQVNAPFGGEKNSGLGRFNGQWIAEEFTRLQWITVVEDGLDYPF